MHVLNGSSWADFREPKSERDSADLSWSIWVLSGSSWWIPVQGVVFYLQSVAFWRGTAHDCRLISLHRVPAGYARSENFGIDRQTSPTALKKDYYPRRSYTASRCYSRKQFWSPGHFKSASLGGLLLASILESPVCVYAWKAEISCERSRCVTRGWEDMSPLCSPESSRMSSALTCFQSIIWAQFSKGQVKSGFRMGLCFLYFSFWVCSYAFCVRVQLLRKDYGLARPRHFH